MHILRGFYPGVDRSMRKIRYVVGEVEGDLNLEFGERVIFAGNCTRWEGRIDGRRVAIEGSYRTAGEVDEGRTASNDMLLKVGEALLRTALNRRSRYLHVKGCPVSVAEHVFYFASLGKTGNPLFDPRLLIPNTAAYGAMRASRFLNRWRV
jgi:hypothetical protein